MEFTIKIEMQSDWHIGFGQTKGDIDSLVQTDKEGLPYIPAKTLTGILRDSCETVALGLDNGEAKGIWHHCLEFLFGSQPALDRSQIETPPIQAILSLRPAYLPQELRKALNSKGKEKVKDAIAFIKQGIKIDNDTGTAEENCLRFEQMIRTGAVLRAEECKINFPEGIKDTEKQMAYALLLAGIQITERIGGKRRRGAGKCQMMLENNKDTLFNDNKGGYIGFLSQQVSLFTGKTTEDEDIKNLLKTFSTASDNDVDIKKISNANSENNSSNGG